MSEQTVRHLSGLSSLPGPPYVTFQEGEDDTGPFFSMWIASPPTVDIEALNAATNTPEAVADERGLNRLLVTYFGYTLSPEEDTLMDRYRGRDTGADFWADVDAAGLRFVPEINEQRMTRRYLLSQRPPAPTAVGTYPELAVLGFAAADARTRANWTEAPGGGALVHKRKKATKATNYQVRYAPPTSAADERRPLDRTRARRAVSRPLRRARRKRRTGYRLPRASRRRPGPQKRA